MTAPTDAKNPAETLARWHAEETAVRTRLQTAPGVASLAQVAGRSGLQILLAILAGEIPPPPMAATLEFTLLSIEPGFAIFQGQPRFNHGGLPVTVGNMLVNCRSGLNPAKPS